MSDKEEGTRCQAKKILGQDKHYTSPAETVSTHTWSLGDYNCLHWGCETLTSGWNMDHDPYIKIEAICNLNCEIPSSCNLLVMTLISRDQFPPYADWEAGTSGDSEPM